MPITTTDGLGYSIPPRPTAKAVQIRSKIALSTNQNVQVKAAPSKGTTFAGLKEEIRFIFEAAGGKEIRFVSEKETTLADGTTLARELVVEWTGVSPGGQIRVKMLTLWVIKGNKQLAILLIDLADYWATDEAELREVGYSLQFK